MWCDGQIIHGLQSFSWKASPGLLQPTAFKYFQISTPFLRVEFETIKRANTLCIGRSVSIVQQAPTVKHGLIIYIWYLTGLCVVYSGSLLQNTAPGGELSIRSLPFCRLLKPRCSAGIAPDRISSADSTSFLCLSFCSRYPANHNRLISTLEDMTLLLLKEIPLFTHSPTSTPKPLQAVGIVAPLTNKYQRLKN